LSRCGRKTETATRLRGRVESLLDWAIVRNYRCGDNHPCWRGHLDMLLEVPKKVAQVEHLAALPYADISSFMTELRKEYRMALALLNSRS